MQKISLIIPCYNEENRLPEEHILDFLSSHPDISLLLVNDGSKDNTGRSIDRLAGQNPSQVFTLHLSSNRGKAEAVRQGMLKAFELNHAAWLGFWDADLATPLEQIDDLLAYAKYPVKMILCSRVKRLGARIERHLWRHLGGRIMATLISIVLKLPVYDTQCGAKLIHRDTVKTIFSAPFLSKWLFDVEILFRFHRLYPDMIRDNSVIEIPVLRWMDVSGSKMRFRHIIRSLFDILRIYIAYRHPR